MVFLHAVDGERGEECSPSECELLESGKTTSDRRVGDFTLVERSEASGGKPGRKESQHVALLSSERTVDAQGQLSDSETCEESSGKDHPSVLCAGLQRTCSERIRERKLVSYLVHLEIEKCKTHLQR